MGFLEKILNLFYGRRNQKGQLSSLEWLISLVVAVFVLFLLYKLAVAVIADT